MRLLFDADGLIKLNRAGVLRNACSAFTCLVPEAVYEEVVTQGKVRLYEDAEEIEQLLSGTVEVMRADVPNSELTLGRGEQAVLAVAIQEQDVVVVSDDRRFLSLLTAREIPFLTPADLLVVMVRRGVILRNLAQLALERLRPLIRTSAYWETKEVLAEKVSNEN